jgi:hypothetical protein
MKTLINGQYIETDLNGQPIQPGTTAGPVVADPPAAAGTVPGPAADGPGPAAVKSAVRKMYESQVYLIWHTYSDELDQISINYSDALTLGKVERNDKLRLWHNTAEIKAFEKRDKNLAIAYKNYLAAETGPELKAVFVHSQTIGPLQWIAQTDSGQFFKAKILERNQHAVYVAVGAFIRKVAGDQLYHFKSHAGYIVLISDDDPLQDVLFTISPVDHSGK